MRVVSLLAFVACASLVQASYLNVHGDPLQRCSQAGMALTGYTRSGECYAHDDDHGSHHVCVDVSSTTGGNFCSVTVTPPPLPAPRPSLSYQLAVTHVLLQGQPNWCSSKMQCDTSPKELCPVKQWCVCQWAFASYIDKAGGCVPLARSCIHPRLALTMKQMRPHPKRCVRGN